MNNLKVYLADDEYYVRTSLKENIPWKENGFEVIGEANNGKTALRQISDLQPDIAIIDINMPGCSGLELIQLLTGQNTACKFIILTGYSEFQYAQKAIRLGVNDYILKPIDYPLFVQALIDIRNSLLSETSMIQKVEELETENQQLLTDQYYNDLISCNLASNSAPQYYSVFPAAAAAFNYRAFTVAIIHPLSPVPASAVRSLLTSVQFVLPYTACQNKKNEIFLIIDTGCQTLFPDFLEDLKCLLDQKSIPACIGIGKQYSNIEQLYLAYNEAEIAVQNYCIRKNHVIYYENLETSLPFTGLETKSKHLLKTYILDKNTDKVTAFIKQMYHDFELQQITFHSVILYTLELITLLTEVLSSQSARPVSLLSSQENVLDKLSAMQSIEKIQEWILHIYTDAITNLIKEKENYCDVTQNIEQYILKNYSNPDLTIPFLAEHLYLNYSYLCLCFKRDKNITINDYLNQVRMEKAVELLQSGVDNITYVAEKTGFNNAGYFSKRFKKAIGLSPSEYLKTITG